MDEINMAGIEALRKKLHLVMEKGDLQQLLEVSRELDYVIVNFMQDSLKNKHMYPKDKMSMKINNQKERSYEYG